MGEQVMKSDLQLQQVLWACYDAWRGESVPEPERTVCYSGVVILHLNRFGHMFHHTLMTRLANFGFLVPGDTSRRGHRRFYKLADPVRARELLSQWGLLSN
jgi:hypothetical protein